MSPQLTFTPNMMTINENSSSSLWRWLLLFGWLLYNYPQIIDENLKKVYPILHSYEIFSLDVRIHFLIPHYFIVLISFMDYHKTLS